METEWTMLISWGDNRFVVVDRRGNVVHVLTAGVSVELLISGVWQSVRVCFGGYRGWYYETSTGVRGRFALSMVARMAEIQGEDYSHTDERLEGVVLLPDVLHQCGERVMFPDEFGRERVGVVVETCVMGKPGLLGLDTDSVGTYVRRSGDVCCVQGAEMYQVGL